MPKPEKSPTFLLRLPPEVRENLEELKDKGQVKSLQALILQFIGEGLAKEGDFKSKELFAKDLHILVLRASVGEGSPDIASMVTVHERVLKDLEDQKLTSYASLLDPGLMAYRLLLDFASNDNLIRKNIDIVGSFTEGLRQSARQAMERGKWGFAEALLLQACDLVPADNPNFREDSPILRQDSPILRQETGIYLARRLVRRWYRPSFPDMTGVTNGHVWQPIHKSEPTEGDIEAVRTIYGDAEKALELLSVETDSHTPEMKCWWLLARIIEFVTRPDGEGVKELEVRDHLGRTLEEVLLIEMGNVFRKWERSFRMSRVASQLQRGWETWLEPLEVLWWLGYRSQAFDIAKQTRGFTGNKSATDRFNLLQGCDPSNEAQYQLDEQTSRWVKNVESLAFDGQMIEEYRETPTEIFKRPMSL